jgi:hypothetical protein
VDVEAWKRQPEAGRRFDRLSLPEKMKRLEGSGLQRPTFADDIISINAARNCLAHRRGIVGLEDVDDAKDFMTVKWHRLRLQATDDGREVGVGSYFEKPTTLAISLVRRSRRFRLGQSVTLTSADYVEVANTFVLYGNQLQASISRFQEARFETQPANALPADVPPDHAS